MPFHQATQQLIHDEDYNVDTKFPYMIYEYIEDQQYCCCVDLFVFSFLSSRFKVKLSKCGKFLRIRTVIPPFFYTGKRLSKSQNHNEKFNQNTHRATAFEEATLPAVKRIGDSEDLIGSETEIRLPFPCDPNEFDWVVLSYKNGDNEFAAECDGNYQVQCILSVTLKCKEKNRITPKRVGKFRICK